MTPSSARVGTKDPCELELDDAAVAQHQSAQQVERHRRDAEAVRQPREDAEHDEQHAELEQQHRQIRVDGGGEHTGGHPSILSGCPPACAVSVVMSG